MQVPTGEIDYEALIRGAGSGVTEKDFPSEQRSQFDELTGHQRLEEQRELTRLKELLPIDEFTGLHNFQRGVTREDIIPRMLGEASRHRHGAAFVHFDLDEFKRINDTLGHAAGDLVIKAFADDLAAVTREADLALHMARGDEFGLLIIDEDDPLAAAESVVKRLRGAFAANTKDLGYGEITFSCGIVKVRGEEDVDDLVKRSDEELYRAKIRRGSVAVEGRELI